MVRTARDRTLIKAHEPSEVRHWATTLRCAEVELIAAVHEVGTNADDVRRHIEASRGV